MSQEAPQDVNVRIWTVLSTKMEKFWITCQKYRVNGGVRAASSLISERRTKKIKKTPAAMAA
jgi:hypothetical protein